MTPERLQKILAAAGLGSRRGCEKIIEEGRVEVNGSRAELGSSADPAIDKIRVDGTLLPARPQARTFAIYKPRKVISSLSAQGDRSTVRDLLPFPGRFYPVGRLDMDSEGLMLLTNDGDLAQRISHPSFEVEKEYLVLVARRPTDEQLAIWRRGVVLEEGFRTSPMVVKFESTEGRGAWLRIIMHEGRKHELRDIGQTIGLPVVRIIRKRIGSFHLGALGPGTYRELTPKETADLLSIPAQPEMGGKAKAAPAWRSGARPAQRKFQINETTGRQEFPARSGKGGSAKAASDWKTGSRPEKSKFHKRETADRQAYPARPGKSGSAKAASDWKTGSRPEKSKFHKRETADRQAYPARPGKSGSAKAVPNWTIGLHLKNRKNRGKETTDSRALPARPGKGGRAKAAPDWKTNSRPEKSKFHNKEMADRKTYPARPGKGGRTKAAPDWKTGSRPEKSKFHNKETADRKTYPARPGKGGSAKAAPRWKSGVSSSKRKIRKG
jgi:23S rRNA pseudouridine2605 synthase